MEATGRPNWKPALLLGAAGAVAGALLVPYVRTLIPAARTVPAWLLLVDSTFKAALFSFFGAWAGLRLGAAVGLDAPWVRAVVDRGAPPPLRGRFAQAALIGAAASGLVVALDLTLFAHAAPPSTAVAGMWWRGLLASFYGGIVEEILMRLFVMTALVRLVMLVTRARTLSAPIAATAIALAALIFGAGHLPTAAQLGPLHALVVARVLVLNALVGLACGWLYWRRGLEHAMVAHFAGDLVLHVLVGG
ncbi:MAG: CPBP family glutamic-type intramembrane protease [Caldimonas sp.]